MIHTDIDVYVLCTCFLWINGGIFEQRVVLESTSPGRYFEDWRCHPNPDNERIWFSLDTRTQIDAMIVDSISFGTVGGIFEGVDTTSLLVAGTQANAAWMIPVIVSAIGIGIVIARKFWNKKEKK